MSEDDQPRRSGPRLGALRLAPFRYLLGAGMSMQLGGWIQRVALLWVIYEMTGSAVQLAGLGFVSNIFVLIISPFTGTLAGRFGARRMLMLAALAQTAGAVAIAVAVFGGWVTVPMLYLVGAVHSIGQALNQPMRNLLVYDAVGRDLLRNGLGLHSLTGNMMRVVGPSVGGAILAFRGADLAFAVQAVLLLVAVLLVSRLRIDSGRRDARVGIWRDIGSAVAYVRVTPSVRTSVLMALLASTLVYPYMQFMPVFTDNLGGGPREYGLLASAVGIGSLVGTMYVVSGRGGMSTMLWSGVGYMALVAAFTQLDVFWLAFAALVVAGVAHALFSTLNQALVQLNSDEDYRARVMGLYTMSGGLEPFSLLLLGVLAHELGVQSALGGSVGLAALITLGFALVALRSMLRRPKLTPPAPADAADDAAPAGS